MNHLVLDLSDPDIADALADCDTGETVTFKVTGTLTKTDKTASVDLDSVEYEGGSDKEDASESADEGMPAPAGKKYPGALDKAVAAEEE